MNDYKDYSENYSSIKIEIIPAKNMINILIFSKLRIYLNFLYILMIVKKKQKNRINKNDKVTKIVIIMDY